MNKDDPTPKVGKSKVNQVKQGPPPEPEVPELQVWTGSGWTSEAGWYGIRLLNKLRLYGQKGIVT